MIKPSANSNLYTSSETGKATLLPTLMTIALEANYSGDGRMALQIDRRLHLATPENPTGETVYMDGFSGPEAVTGQTYYPAAIVAAQLRQFIRYSGHNLMGVRIAAASAPYRSKIIFYPHKEVEMDEIYQSIAFALEVEYSDVELLMINGEPPSETECSDRAEFEFDMAIYSHLREY